MAFDKIPQRNSILDMTGYSCYYNILKLGKDKEYDEMRVNYLKIIGIFLALLLILNITLLALNKISEMIFWIVVIIGAVFAYLILPKMKK